MKMEKYAEAIDSYNRALTEHRNPDSLNALRKVRIDRFRKRGHPLAHVTSLPLSRHTGRAAQEGKRGEELRQPRDLAAGEGEG